MTMAATPPADPNATAIHRRVAVCRDGTDPTMIARMRSGWAVLGDPQVLPGYCLLLPDPVVPHLNALEPAAQQVFLADMARLGQAVQDITDAVRINYAMFGNVEPALHAHVIPRYEDEPADLIKAQPWAYDWKAAPRFDPDADRDLLLAIRSRLERTS
jgi:diadenosine tetraphosphate (Ap4A) HIT family hydrolase